MNRLNSLILVVASMLIFAGCSQTKPTMDMAGKNINGSWAGSTNIEGSGVFLEASAGMVSIYSLYGDTCSSKSYALENGAFTLDLLSYSFTQQADGTLLESWEYNGPQSLTWVSNTMGLPAVCKTEMMGDMDHGSESKGM
ncbi:MAG: hypothetical protein HQM12_02920 [SAR324 cluster bacterium]|nr:hypothetical protein [SAR324 cluster bacterium]